MAIGPQHFQPMTWEQANPYTTGMKEAAGLTQAMTQARFLPKQLRAQLEGALLENQIKNVQAQYAPQTTQSEIMLKQGQAEQALANAEWTPFTAQGKYFQGVGDYMRGGYYNSPAVRLRMMLSSMPEADRAAWIAKNGPQVEGILDSLAGGGAYGGIMPMPPMPTARPGSFNIQNPQTGKQIWEPGDEGPGESPGQMMAPQMGQNMRPPMPQQRMPLNQQMQQRGIPPRLQGNPQQRPMPPQAQTIAAPMVQEAVKTAQKDFNPVQSAFENTANKANTAPAMWERWQAAQTAERFVNTPDAVKAFDTLAQYSGVLGKGKEEFVKRFGAEKYADVASAEEQFRVNMAGAIGQLEGFGKTDTALNEGLGYFTLANSSLQGEKPNYQAALKFYQKGLDFLQDKEKALNQATHPLFNNQEREPVKHMNLIEQLGNTVKVMIKGKLYEAPKEKLQELEKKYGATVAK